ncbi:MAG: hypothetical protein MUO30_04810 [Anaerolineales bacterium]|nr:hypothetical protein [Anaerolineales bacterium]
MTFLSRTIAVIFAILFVITTVLVLLLFNIERKMLSADLYKNALADQQIYERLPGIVGNLLTTSISYNPCAENPLVCEDISRELRTCYEQTLGNERYVTLASGKDKATEAEMQAIQPCLNQYGGGTTSTTSEQPTGKNPLPTAPPDVQACVKQAIGENAYNEIYNNKRSPTEAEIQQMTPCFGQAGTGNFGNQGGAQGGMPQFMKNLKASDWETIISILLPANELQAITENVLDQVFAYLNGETDSASNSLVKLRERLSGQAGRDAILQLIAAQPLCTDEQLAEMAAGMLGGGEVMVICAPPEEILAVLMPQLQNQLTALVTQIPDKAMIIKPSSRSTPSSGPLGNDPIKVIRTVRLGLRLSPLLPLGLLLLVTLFGVRSLKGWLRWWGITFFFAGAIALVPGIAMLPALNWAWNNFLVPRIPPFLSADVANIGHEMATYITHGLSEQIILQTAILLAVGLAMWVGSCFIKARAAESTPATPLPPTA